MILIELLPYRQLVAAGSPGSPHEDDDLLATIVGQAYMLSVEGTKGEVRGLLAHIDPTECLNCHLNSSLSIRSRVVL